LAKIKAEGGVGFAELANDIEDRRLARNGHAEVLKIFNHALEAAIVVDDIQVALGEGAGFLIGVQSSYGAVPEQPGLDGSQMLRAEAPCSETVLVRSSEMAPRCQVQTTQFIRTQEGEAGLMSSERT